MFKSNLLKITIILTILLTNSYALKKEEIQSEMAERIDNVLVVLKNKSLSKEEKKNQVISIVNDTFDFELMAKIALGKHSWETLSEEKQKEFTATFEDKLKKSYSDKLELYNDQKVKILSLDPYNNTRLQLKTELLGKEGTYSINYKFYEKTITFIFDFFVFGNRNHFIGNIASCNSGFWESF